jgi:hypothetical protein
MKKLLSIALVLMMVVALAVPSFAYTKDELTALASKAPAAYQNQVKAVIANMTEEQAQAVNKDVVVATAKDLQAKQVAGTVTVSDITNAAATLEGATGVKISVSGVSVNGNTVTAYVDTKINSYEVSVPYNVTATSTGTTDNTGISTGGTGSTVIKATGMSVATSAIVLAMAISGVFGFAIIKSRKAKACA